MLTQQEHDNIAYAAFQTHRKVMCGLLSLPIPDADRLVEEWKTEPQIQTLWRGLVVSIIANALKAHDTRPKAESPEQLAKRLAQEMRERGIRATPIGAQASHTDGMAHVPPASDIVPGLAVGRCTEGPTDGGGSSDTGCTDSGGSDGGGGGGD